MTAPQRMSDRNFGFAFTVFLGLIALAGWVFFDVVAIKTLIAAGIFLVISLAVPLLLLPLNRIWMWFGLKIGPVVNTVILGIFYYAVLLPMGVMMRLLGSDPMTRKKQAEGASYWTPVERKADPETYPDMF